MALRGQYCYKCDTKRIAYGYDKDGFRLPLCKTHKRLETASTYEKIQYAMKVRERSLLKRIKHENRNGCGYDFKYIFSTRAACNALSRLKEKGIITYRRVDSYDKRGYWVVDMKKRVR